ncbi:BTB/POZ domain-containing protein At3g05675 isoform X2 [Andrographis paniculata]|uniref:BTB/POZ domain-containing protein At3g05675 isoform X2 n=1 Tax=Andrographis paniculata TaxID=175694 RepID=UPI0021E80AE6|nr:BTB/POZ domain-containing protein At3g05675 isoform X2 [Andrographis paniculata]
MMEISYDELGMPSTIGNRSTSDVVVRIRTQEGRDDWIYCHSQVLVKKSKYFADRLSDNWPTCQIIDSRSCVEVYCEESDFDHHVNVLRLLYINSDVTMADLCSVKNALGTLRVAAELGISQIVSACVGYLEAVPWEESEEEEILKIIPEMGSQTEPVLARLRPVNPLAVFKIFLSAIRFATSSPPSSIHDLKISAQEQLEYMLTEDDDAPLLSADDKIKSEARSCVNDLLVRFSKLLTSLLGDLNDVETSKMETFQSYLNDVAWASQILTKLETSGGLVRSWVDSSLDIVKILDRRCSESSVKVKVLEITAKVLEAIGFGAVILPAAKRLHMIRVWLPFARRMRSSIDSPAVADDDGDPALKPEDEAEILTEWLRSEEIRYPDLTEAFEVWCYRSKVSRRRLARNDRTSKKV